MIVISHAPYEKPVCDHVPSCDDEFLCAVLTLMSTPIEEKR